MKCLFEAMIYGSDERFSEKNNSLLKNRKAHFIITIVITPLPSIPPETQSHSNISHQNLTPHCDTTHYNTPQHARPQHTTPHYTTPHYEIPHYTTLHRTTKHHTTPHHTKPHHTTPHHTTPHHTTPHHTTPHHTTPTTHEGRSVSDDIPHNLLLLWLPAPSHLHHRALRGVAEEGVV